MSVAVTQGLLELAIHHLYLYFVTISASKVKKVIEFSENGTFFYGKLIKLTDLLELQVDITPGYNRKFCRNKEGGTFVLL